MFRGSEQMKDQQRRKEVSGDIMNLFDQFVEAGIGAHGRRNGERAEQLELFQTVAPVAPTGKQAHMLAHSELVF